MKNKIPVRMIRPMVSRSLYYRFILGRHLERIASLWTWPSWGLAHVFNALVWLFGICAGGLETFYERSYRAWFKMIANAIMSKEELDSIWDAFDKVRMTHYVKSRDEGHI